MRPIRSISVLMPTWQGMEFLERVLRALSEQRCALPWDFLAIDSGSRDGTWEALGEWSARFPVPLRRLRIDQVEFDHGDTRNLLAAESTGDLLVFMTQDAIPAGPDWLATLAANFEDEAVGAAYCRNVPRPDAELLTKLFSADDPGYATERREVRRPPLDAYARMNAHEKRVLWNFNDVASAVRRELWERHPFPRTWFGEDVLMARALIEAGFTVVFDARAKVEHSHDYSAEETEKRAQIDGRFSAEWLDRVCIASKSDARTLAERLLERDRAELRAAGLDDREYGRQLELAARLRTAAFDGLFAGGTTNVRRPATRVLERTQLSILYVVHGFPPDTWAGTEIYTYNLALEMQRRGHTVTVLARAPATHADEVDFTLREETFQGLRVVRMTHRLQHRSLRESYRHAQAEAVFAALLERESFDVVHFQHLIHTSVGLVEIAKEHGLATIVHLHDYWALCARVQLIRPDGVVCAENQGAGCFLCVKDKWLDLIPAARAAGGLFGAAGALVADLAGKDEYADMLARHDEVTSAYAAADLRISPSRFLRAKLLESGRFEAHTTLFSDNGMRTDHVAALAKAPDPSGRLRVGFVGSLVWYKGGEVLMSALRELADLPVVLNVFGDFKPQSDAHHARLQELAGPNVSFRGRFDNAKLSEVYAEIDVLVVPSVWYENSPITMHEAWLTRTPIVASDLGGMREFVREGIDGLRFVAGDARDLARVLRRFVDEPGLLASLSRDFPRAKSIQEDGAATEFRYRALCTIVRADASGERVLYERKGYDAQRSTSCERQGDDCLLMRPGTDAHATFDLSSVGGGRRRIVIEQLALAPERDLWLCVHATLDGVEHVFEAWKSSGRDELRRHELELDLSRGAHTLTLRCGRTNAGVETYARVVRVQVVRVQRVKAGSA